MISDTMVAPEAFDSSTPRFRNDALVRRYDSEAVAWSPAGIEPVHLDPVAALLVTFLDGETAVGELVADVAEAVGVPEAVARNRIRGIISVLDDGALLDSSPSQEAETDLGIFPAPRNH